MTQHSSVRDAIQPHRHALLHYVVSIGSPRTRRQVNKERRGGASSPGVSVELPHDFLALVGSLRQLFRRVAIVHLSRAKVPA